MRRAVLVVCLVLLLTGCQLPGTVRPTVKIGLVAPFEGRYRYVGYDVIYAVRTALREANAAGGVGGYNVELVAYDDGGNPAMAVEQARKLAIDPALTAVIGHFRDETTLAALDTYAEAGIPLVAPAVLDPALTSGQASVYRLGPPAEVIARALIEHLRAMGRSPVALVAQDKDSPLGSALRQAVQADQLTFGPTVFLSAADWSITVLKSGAEVVVCDADPVTAGEVVSALRMAGWNGAFLGGPALAAPDFASVAGETIEGVTFITPWPIPKDIPESADLTTAYRAASGGFATPGPLALPAYEATWMLLEALAQDIATHGTPTREGVATALSTVQRDGLLGHITFDSQRNWSDAPLYRYRLGPEALGKRVDE